MNKQELVKTLMKRMEDFGYFPTFTNVKTFIKEYEKLAKPEPQKPVVKKFVADWYEKHKNSLEFNIFDYVYRFDQNEESDLKDWFDDINTNTFQTLVNMHQFGYEIEKEKRYLVKMRGINNDHCYLNCVTNNDNTKEWIIDDNTEYSNIITKHTRKDLEDAGFGWVFDCQGVEVEEV